MLPGWAGGYHAATCRARDRTRMQLSVHVPEAWEVEIERIAEMMSNASASTITKAKRTSCAALQQELDVSWRRRRAHGPRCARSPVSLGQPLEVR